MEDTVRDPRIALQHIATSREVRSRLTTSALLILEVFFVVAGFRLLDRVSFHVLVWLGVLSEKPAVTMQLVFLLSTISTALLTTALIGLQKVRGQRFTEFGFSTSILPTIRKVGLLIFYALVFQILMGQIVEPVLESVFSVPKSPPIVSSIPALLLGYAVSFIGGGFREELFFRGYLIARIRNISFIPAQMAFYCAVVIQAVLFGFSHWYQGPAGVIGTTLTGLAFTIVYLKTRSLWFAILFHGFFDVFGFTAIYLS